MGDVAALRVSTPEDRSWDDPAEDLLFDLLHALGPGNQYLVLDRLAADGHFMQVYREPDGTFAVEYREGLAGGHYEALTADLNTVHDVLTGWAYGRPGWREALPWRRRH